MVRNVRRGLSDTRELSPSNDELTSCSPLSPSCLGVLNAVELLQANVNGRR